MHRNPAPPTRVTQHLLDRARNPRRSICFTDERRFLSFMPTYTANAAVTPLPAAHASMLNSPLSLHLVVYRQSSMRTPRRQ